MSFRTCAMLTIALFSGLAHAAPAECATESQRSHLVAFRDKVASAASPAEAKQMVLRQSRYGHAALDKAARFAPEHADIQSAQARLVDFEAGVNAASTQAEVAEQVDEVVLAGADAAACAYTPVEIIVIVIGFILGILPGILFLFLFC